MESSMLKGLRHSDYERRKVASLQMEALVRDLALEKPPDDKRIKQIISQLWDYAAPRSAEGPNNMAMRSGGMIGLAGVTAGLSVGPDVLPAYLAAILKPVFAALDEAHPNIRFFATESIYNITKSAQGEILPYFNEVFDAMCKLVADTEASIKNGAELLDRTLKDIVAEYATTYITGYGPSDSIPSAQVPPEELEQGVGLGFEKPFDPQVPAKLRKAFSLSRLVPLVAERIHVLNPFTRGFIISWLQLLDSVPDLQLVTFLPAFLEGLMRYLSDPTAEVRVTTEGLLEGMLREIRDCREAELDRRRRRVEWDRIKEERRRIKRLMHESRERQKLDRRASEAKTVRHATRDGDKKQSPEDGSNLPEADEQAIVDDDEQGQDDDVSDETDDDYDDEDPTEWQPGEGVDVDYAAIVSILVEHLDSADEEIQSICLHWIATFLEFVPGTVIPFAPKIIPIILKGLGHHVPAIQAIARTTNDLFYSIVYALPDPEPHKPAAQPTQAQAPLAANSNLRKDTSPTLAQLPRDRNLTSSPPPSSIPFPSATPGFTPRHDRNKPGSDASIGLQPISQQPSTVSLARFNEPPSLDTGADSVVDDSFRGLTGDESSLLDEFDVKFEYAATVNEVTFALVSENEETQVAALQWLLMLHQKAPRKIISPSDAGLPRGTGPDSNPAATTGRQRQHSSATTASAAVNGISIALLLKILSEATEQVVRYNIQLVAQISTCSVLEEMGIDYFPSFMKGVLDLFSTDRKLLENKGSFIIRQLCTNLNPERIYRTCAELLEKDESDLEFSSIMVQNLNLIMITSPELADFRRRLRTLDTKDGQNLFSVLYRSWSHNAVATFTLCLLAQAYEQACALLQIFAELEITVSLLIQIDKLVQLLESPVFTALRLQLLEPERHPYLLKALYGLLMLLPQSSAFATLRNRLSAVSSLGFLQTVPRAAFGAGPGARGSTITSPSTATPLNRRDTPTESPHIRWNELLGHFRHVQKKRAAILSNSPNAPPGPGGINSSSSSMSIGATPNDSFDSIPPHLTSASSYAGSAPTSRIMPVKRRGVVGPSGAGNQPPVPSRSENSLAGILAHQNGAGSGFTSVGASSRIFARPSAAAGGTSATTTTSQTGSGSSVGVSRDGNATPVAVQRAVSPTAQAAAKRRLGPTGSKA
ncbi:Vac14p [Sporobolomyces koalae]|uniref:Vac14p n=1 Tax=Sporobolomyces koalae TaxID=500713 RepID=UPI003179A0FB